jgi:LuxR family transcriptional activator of conjugal transfer of Ti plasmids
LWDGREARPKSAKERRLFDDALSFKIRTGLTIRIPATQNQFAAFTLAVDDRSLGLDRFIESSQDLLQMVGLTYHAHVTAARIGRTGPNGQQGTCLLSANSSVAWISEGQDDAGHCRASRCYAARREVSSGQCQAQSTALTLPHAVALALRQGLLE